MLLASGTLALAACQPGATVPAAGPALRAAEIGGLIASVCLASGTLDGRAAAARALGFVGDARELRHPTEDLTLSLDMRSNGNAACRMRFLTEDRGDVLARGVAASGRVAVFDRRDGGGSLRVRGSGDDDFGLWSDPPGARGAGYAVVTMYDEP